MTTPDSSKDALFDKMFESVAAGMALRKKNEAQRFTPVELEREIVRVQCAISRMKKTIVPNMDTILKRTAQRKIALLETELAALKGSA